jgi:hypothetical protein
MDKQTKKKLDKLLSLGQSISKISQSLELNNDEVSRYVRQFFASHKTRKKDDRPGVVVNFPKYKTIQLRLR